MTKGLLFAVVVALITTDATAQGCGPITAQQTVGPFFPNPGTPEIQTLEDHASDTPIYLANDNDLTFVKGKASTAQGQVVVIRGSIRDVECRPIPNATVIIWQAASTGRYNHKRDLGSHHALTFPHPATGEMTTRTLDPLFQYWGKSETNADGDYAFKTVVPSFYPADLRTGWYRPPHIHFMVLAPGFPRFATQMYFGGEGLIENNLIKELNQKDRILQASAITDEQRQQLVVRFARDPGETDNDELAGQFDIVLAK